MEDRFKFRVWNDMQKCYSQDDHYIDEDGQLNTSGKYIIAQCTGIKDRNGNLIYEGDIVRTNYPYETGYYSVKWGDGCWELWKKNMFIYNLYEKFGQYVEIIGNMHENPELLGESK